MPFATATQRPATLAYDATPNPADMSPDERRHEIAAILAKGVLRLRVNAKNSPVSRPHRTPEISSKSQQEALDAGAKTSLHVTACPPSRQA